MEMIADQLGSVVQRLARWTQDPNGPNVRAPLNQGFITMDASEFRVCAFASTSYVWVELEN